MELSSTWNRDHVESWGGLYSVCTEAIVWDFTYSVSNKSGKLNKNRFRCERFFDNFMNKQQRFEQKSEKFLNKHRVWTPLSCANFSPEKTPQDVKARELVTITR